MRALAGVMGLWGLAAQWGGFRGLREFFPPDQWLFLAPQTLHPQMNNPSLSNQLPKILATPTPTPTPACFNWLLAPVNVGKTSIRNSLWNWRVWQVWAGGWLVCKCRGLSIWGWEDGLGQGAGAGLKIVWYWAGRKRVSQPRGYTWNGYRSSVTSILP